MKKFGIIIFIAAIAIGVLFASFFDFGKATGFFNLSFNKSVKGSGNVASETRDLAGFNGVNVGGVFEAEITAGSEYALRIEADDNLLPHIKTEIDGDTLEISTDKRISSDNPIRVFISAPNIERLHASGASKVSITGLKNEEFQIDSSGASKINAAGTSASLRVDVSGASRIDAENLKTEKTTVHARGASFIKLFVTGELDGEASGASSITYAGNPKNVEKRSFGASHITHK